MTNKAKEVLKKLEFGFLEVFIGFFMIIGLIGYFGSLPADLDWIDHTVAFLMFSYFFYMLDITSILFGATNKFVNLLLVISYLSLFFKDIISYTQANAFEFAVITLINDFYLFFENNLRLTNFIAFYIGIIGILVASIYLSKKIVVSHPSFLYSVSKGKFKNNLTKISLILISLLAFYYLIYNPILEWLEFVLDDPIVLIGIVYFAVTIARHHRKFHEKHAVFKIGDVVWGWYKRFISLFHYKRTLPLAVSGLLILHALSDLGVFAYSLVFLKENFYLEFLKEEHTPFLRLFLEDAKNIPSSVVIPLFIDYLLNALSLMIFLLIPVIVWISLFSQKGLHLSRVLLFFIYASAVSYVLVPAYIIMPLSDSSLVGVDILSASLLESKSVLEDFFPNKSTIIFAVSLISIAFGLIIYVLSSNSKIKRELYAISIIGGLTFYAIYLYYFFSSLLLYFYNNILILIFTPHFLIGAILAVFLVLSIMFYIGGYLMFLYEIVMEYHKRKWSEPIDEELVAAIRKIKSVEMSEIAKGRFKGIFKGNKAISEHAPKPKVLDKKMIKPKKAQIIGEVFKYGMVGVVSIVILIAGYKMINVVKERACKTEIAKFEIDLRNLDTSLRFGARELQSYDVPCKADRIYFFDLNKNLNPEDFNEIPIIKDSIRSGGNDNVFIVKEGGVKRSLYAGNLEMIYPYHICFLPKFDKISFFAEGAGNSAKIAAACNQPECTFIPIDISEEEARKIIQEAIEFGCRNCPNNFDKEIAKIRLTRQNVEMLRKFSFCDGFTTVDILIKPKKGVVVKRFRFYEFIPKSCIDDLNKYLAENVEGNVEIKGDPLIMWYFEDIGVEKRVSYKLNTSLDDECKQAIQGLGVAQFVSGQAAQFVEEQIEEKGIGKENTAPRIGGLSDITLSGIKLHKSVITNIWKYAQDKETDAQRLVYTIIDQTNSDLVECSISNEKHIDCEVKQDKDGISIVTAQVDDFEFIDRTSFSVEVSQSCKKHERKTCVGNSVFWLDSCNNQEELDKACAFGEACKDGECEESCTPNAERKCKENEKIYWFDSCGKQGSLYYNCKDNPIRTKCKNGQCCTILNLFCTTPKPGCEDECTAGEKRCSDSGYQVCGDYNNDGCFEWSQITNCGSDSCDNFGSWTCKDSLTRTRARTCYSKGCSEGSCYSSSVTDTDEETCPIGKICQNGNCVNAVAQLSVSDLRTTRIVPFDDGGCTSNRCYYVATISNSGNANGVVSSEKSWYNGAVIDVKNFNQVISPSSSWTTPETSFKSDCFIGYSYELTYHDGSGNEIGRKGVTCSNP